MYALEGLTTVFQVWASRERDPRQQFGLYEGSLPRRYSRNLVGRQVVFQE